VAAEDPVVPGPDATKDHLYDVARRLRVRGRSTMSRGELRAAIEAAHRAAERRPPDR
jgi:hypothetical protein